MTLRWEQIIVDAADPVGLARWWMEVLSYRMLDESTDEAEIGPADGRYPRLLFVEESTPKTVKNRLHIDLRPDDQAAEVERLLGMGARRIDIGQGDVPWVVMADPEGNEFCVLAARPLR